MTPKRADGDRAPLPDVYGIDVANDDGNPFMSEASLPEVGGAASAPIDDPLLLIVPDPPPPQRSSTTHHRLTAVTSLPRPTEVHRFRLPPQAVQTASLVGAGVIVGVAITLFTISPGPAAAPGQASSERRSGVVPVLVATSLSERSQVPFASSGSSGEASTPVLPADVAAPVVDSALAENRPVLPPTPETSSTAVPTAPPLVAEAPRKVDAAIPVEVRPVAPAPSEIKSTASAIKPTVADSRPTPTAPAITTTVADSRPTLSEIKPAVPNEKSAVAETKPTLAEARPTPAEIRPTPADVKPVPSAVTRSTDSAPVLSEPPIARVEGPVLSEPVVPRVEGPVLSEPVVTRVEGPPVRPSAPPATANAGASSSDRQAVDGLLNVYKESYTRRDASLLAAVWRGLEADKLARAFGSLATQELKFYSCKVSMEDARATASCHGRLVFVPRVGAPYPRERALTWAFEFSRNSGQWLIERVKIE